MSNVAGTGVCEVHRPQSALHHEINSSGEAPPVQISANAVQIADATAQHPIERRTAVELEIRVWGFEPANATGVIREQKPVPFVDAKNERKPLHLVIGERARDAGSAFAIGIVVDSAREDPLLVAGQSHSAQIKVRKPAPERRARLVGIIHWRRRPRRIAGPKKICRAILDLPRMDYQWVIRFRAAAESAAIIKRCIARTSWLFVNLCLSASITSGESSGKAIGSQP